MLLVPRIPNVCRTRQVKRSVDGDVDVVRQDVNDPAFHVLVDGRLHSVQKDKNRIIFARVVLVANWPACFFFSSTIPVGIPQKVIRFYLKID